MNHRAVWAIVRKDLKLFFSDRRALLMVFLTPVAIAAFFGFIFSGNGGDEATKIPVLVADLDGSDLSKAVAQGLLRETVLEVKPASEAEARETVRKGKAAVAVVLPAGFGAAAGRAFFNMAPAPEVRLLCDPSRGAEVAMVRGILTQHVMEAASAAVFGGPQGSELSREALAQVEADPAMPTEDKDALSGLLKGVADWNERAQASPEAAGKGPAKGLSLPFVAKEEPVTARSGVRYNGYAHSFAGMAVQFLLFAAIEVGVGILYERRQGHFRRLRAAPLSRTGILAGKFFYGVATALMVLGVTFGAGALIFGVRVHGSFPGFLLLCGATAAMSASFGIMLASLGRSPEAARGLAIFIVLLCVMLGGGWIPAFIFPGWLQTVTLAVPTRWAVDGFDAVTWRGQGFAEGAALPSGILLLFAAFFGSVAVRFFPWEKD
jgi:ABC-2 type transport system permease protein